MPDRAETLIRTVIDPVAGLQPGYLDAQFPAQPAAGAGFTHTVPDGYFEQLVMLSATLATSATVANRFLLLNYVNPDGSTVCSVELSAAFAASSTHAVSAFVGASSQGTITGNQTNAALPSLALRPGWQFQLAVVNIDPADQLSGLALGLARYPSQWAGGDLAQEQAMLLQDLYREVTGHDWSPT